MISLRDHPDDTCVRVLFWTDERLFPLINTEPSADRLLLFLKGFKPRLLSVRGASPARVSGGGAGAPASLVHGLDHHPAGAAHPALWGRQGGRGGEREEPEARGRSDFLRGATSHLGVSRHDGVVAVVVQRGGGGVQRAGPVGLAADPVVLAPLGDLLAVFEPVDLRGGAAG